MFSLIPLPNDGRKYVSLVLSYKVQMPTAGCANAGNPSSDASCFSQGETLREQVGKPGRQSPQVGKPAHGAGSPTHWLDFALNPHSITVPNS
ncbi:hypothetical protein [Nostoc sp.]|uniref:hypothetical protein n=1 Tax=Nostoc sp. TaxID=1180 RepID=UPI002FF8C063